MLDKSEQEVHSDVVEEESPQPDLTSVILSMIWLSLLTCRTLLQYLSVAKLVMIMIRLSKIQDGLVGL